MALRVRESWPGCTDQQPLLYRQPRPGEGGERERSGQEPKGRGLGDKLLEIAERIVKAPPGKLDLHISITGAPPQDPVKAAIDVTPGK
ncbi:MAG: hypothetical protein OER90_12240 [Gemmatimonadota bacterium]|nr:hypothetical protein [Gemmatimonadota bacterium]